MKVEIGRDLPQGWVSTQLGELGLFINGDRGKNYPNKEALVESGISFINAGHIQNGVIKLSEMNYITEKRFNLLGSGKVKPNDILYCLRGSLGKTAIVKNITTGAIASSLVIVRPSDYSDYEYLFYYLISPFGDAEIRKHDNGSAQPNLSAKSLRSYSVPLPPLNEQKRIVTKIEALQTRSSAVKEELEAIKPLLDQFRQSVLAAAFRGDLTKDWREQNPDVEPAEVLLERIRGDRRRRWEEAELEKMKAKGKVPKDDKWKKKYKEPEPIDTEGLSELADGWCWINYELITQESQNGLSKRRGTQGQSISVLRLADIKNNKIAPEETREILLTDNEIERYLLYPNDLLCIRVNGSEDLVGRIIIFDQDNKWAFCDHFIRYKLVDKLVSVSYIANFFKTQVVRQYIKQYKVSSAGQNTVSQTTLGNLLTPIPPIKEQKEIVRRIESLFKLADSIEQQYQQAEVDLETLNQSILAKAFRGELVPQDPNDEPASVLLERIREEKAQPKKSKSKKKSKVTKAKQLGLDL